MNDYLQSALSFEEGAQKVFDEFGVHVILREREYSSSYKKGYALVEDASYTTRDRTYVCNEDTGFYQVNPEDSVIFVSAPTEPSGMQSYVHYHIPFSDLLVGPYRIELVVLRDVLGEPEVSEPLLEWVNAVICAATCNRRNVRVSSILFYIRSPG